MTETTEHDRKSPQASTKKTRNKVTYVPEPLPETGLVRLPTVLAVYPVSRSMWWDGIRSGKYPAGVKLSARITAWKVEDIRALIENAE